MLGKGDMLAARLVLGSAACRVAASLRLQPFHWYHTDNSSSSNNTSSTTDFGFQQVNAAEKAGLVAQVFSNVAPSYDIMNDLMSAGLHRLWKNHLVQVLRPFAGMQHLDVAGGTGDVAFRVLQAIQQAEALAQRRQQTAHGWLVPATQPEPPELGTVTVCDINPEMLKEGMKRADSMGVPDGRLCWVEGDAERLPFEDESFDAYTVTFGIRNVTNRDAALREALRVLRRGGRFLCMEFSQVEEPLLRQVYDSYSFSMIPLMGQLVAGDRASYQYLVESIRMFPTQEEFRAMIEDAGFKEVRYENLLGGVVALHSGFKL